MSVFDRVKSNDIRLISSFRNGKHAFALPADFRQPVAGLLLANGLLVLALLRERPAQEWRSTYLLTFGANLLVLASTFWLGLNDGFVAALLIGAVLARRDNRVITTGILLGLATLDKYYPALLIPFFAPVSNQRAGSHF